MRLLPKLLLWAGAALLAARVLARPIALVRGLAAGSAFDAVAGALCAGTPEGLPWPGDGRGVEPELLRLAAGDVPRR